MSEEEKPVVPQLVESTTASGAGGAGPRVVPGPAYVPWRRPRTYVSFALGIGAASMLLFCLFPHAVIMGWFALGMGIPAVLVGKKEISDFPEAQNVPFIKWGIRTGLMGIVLGPLSALIYISIFLIAGMSGW